jgi:ribosomal protein S18 acetylase RimI-like enzyme
VGARNSRAQRFYHAYGFTELSRQDWGVTFGMKL